MYRCIVLTLDGSALGEQAKPHAVELARKLRCRLIIARVVPPLVLPLDGGYGMTPATVYQELLDAEMSEAQSYLDQLVEPLKAEGLEAEGRVLFGSPAASILDLVEGEEADLVIMATHGRTGLPRFVLGSVANEIMRGAGVPVMLVRAS